MLDEAFQSELLARRRSICEGLGDGALLLFAPPVRVRNRDVEYEYRQGSDFFYLTGFQEPDAVLLLTAKPDGYALFVRPKDPEREIWDGRRAGIEGAVGDFGADVAHEIGSLDEKLPDLLSNVRRLFFQLGEDRSVDERVLRTIDRVRAKGRTGVEWPTEIVDPRTLIHEARLKKSAFELNQMKRAAELSAHAHLRAMQACRPGMFEYEIEAILLGEFRKGGSPRVAYPSIVGSGPNATILHYRENDRRMEEGDLLLIDAGAEFGHYAADITRTFPVGGRFTEAQRSIYQIVLDAQLAAIEECRPGATLDAIHDAALQVIAAGLVKLGLLEGPVETAIEKEESKRYFMHRTSHYLGMDVHDVGRYFVDGKPRPLEPGVVITVEPGIYIADDDATVPEKYRGIGVRIEDDVVVTDGVPLVLTDGVPKTVDAVEAACAAS